MTKKNTLLILGAVGAGITFYFVRQAYLKKKGTSNNQFNPLDVIQPSASSSTPSSGSVSGSGSSSSSVSSNPFKTTNEVKAFQDWMDATNPFWINDNGKWKNLRVGTAAEPNRHVNGVGYGNWGSNTSTAWNIFGKAYLALPNNSTNVTPQGGSSESTDLAAIKTAGLESMFNILSTGGNGKFAKYSPKFVAAARPYLRVDKNNIQYYIFGDKKFGIYNTSSNSWVAKGIWAINGQVTTATSVYNFPTFSKRKTVFNANPLTAIAGSQLEALTDNKSAFIANKIYDAVKDLGTEDPAFYDAMSGIKNQRQYAQVYDAFGIKGGFNLDQWINNDLAELQERRNWNTKYFALTGLRLNESSLTIVTKSTSQAKVSFPF